MARLLRQRRTGVKSFFKFLYNRFCGRHIASMTKPLLIVGDSWSNRHLAALLGAEFLRLPGCTAAEIAAKMPERIAGDVLVLAGVNDALRWFTGPRRYAAGICAIASRCERPLVLEMPPVTRWVGRYRDRLRAVYTSPILPFPEMGAECWRDPCHLNATGRARLAEAVRAVCAPAADHSGAACGATQSGRTCRPATLSAFG